MESMLTNCFVEFLGMQFGPCSCRVKIPTWGLLHCFLESLLRESLLFKDKSSFRGKAGAMVKKRCHRLSEESMPRSTANVSKSQKSQASCLKYLPLPKKACLHCALFGINRGPTHLFLEHLVIPWSLVFPLWNQ